MGYQTFQTGAQRDDILSIVVCDSVEWCIG